MPRFCRGSGCHHPQTILPVGMLCITHTQILKVVYHICCEMYRKVLTLLQTVPIIVCCVLHGWNEHHTAKGCAHSGQPIHINFGCDHHSLFLSVNDHNKLTLSKCTYIRSCTQLDSKHSQYCTLKEPAYSGN